MLRQRVGTDHFDTQGQVFGTQIHHAGALSGPVRNVAIAMILPSERACLVRRSGAPSDILAPEFATNLTAVDLASIAPPADKEDLAAP